jgi:hypothetical protein
VYVRKCYPAIYGGFHNKLREVLTKGGVEACTSGLINPCSARTYYKRTSLMLSGMIIAISKRAAGIMGMYISAMRRREEKE